MGYNMLENIDIGTVRSEWKNDLSGYRIDYSDLHGFSLYAFLQSPSDEEIERMSKNSDLVIYFEDMKGVGFFTFNFSGTGGSSAFAPSLQLDYPTFNVPSPLNSYPMHINLIDSTSGELKAKRTVSLSSEFSDWLSGWCRENETLNYSLDSVKTISREYFDSLKERGEDHSFRVAYDSSKSSLLHERNSYER